MRNTEWHQPPRFYHSNCQKEERTLAGTSLLPTCTEAHASEVYSDASQARAFTMISRQTTVLRISDISPVAPLHPPAPAVSHLLLGLAAASICSSRVILRRWRMALALPAFLINRKRWVFHAIAGCRLLTAIAQLTWCKPSLFAQDGSLQVNARQEWPKPSPAALRVSAAQLYFLNQSKVDYLSNERWNGDRGSACRILSPIMQWSRDYITRGVRLQRCGSHDTEPSYGDRLATCHRRHLCNPEIKRTASITY